MNLLYRQNQGRAGNKIKNRVWDCNNSSSGCRVSLTGSYCWEEIASSLKVEWLPPSNKQKEASASVSEGKQYIYCRWKHSKKSVLSLCFSAFLFSPCVSFFRCLPLQIKTIQFKASLLYWSGHICILYLENSKKCKRKDLKRKRICSLPVLWCPGGFIWDNPHYWGVSQMHFWNGLYAFVISSPCWPQTSKHKLTTSE